MPDRITITSYSFPCDLTKTVELMNYASRYLYDENILNIKHAIENMYSNRQYSGSECSRLYDVLHMAI